MKIVNVVGARPNFMKIAPLMAEFKKHKNIEAVLVHTGQHYDKKMSKKFFDDLDIPKPDINLEVGSKSHAKQTAEIMIRFEKVLLKERPDLVLVVGDVNSTIACALTAVKLGIKVVHVEAGLRSFDRTMPEEINRVLTDAISDLLFVTEKEAIDNLIREGVCRKKIHFVGNVMIDTLFKCKQKADKSNILKKLKLKSKEYAMLTLHRPSNVDCKATLARIFEALEEISKNIKIIFPVHPRTKSSLERFKIKSFSRYSSLDTRYNNILFIDPLGYLDSLKLMSNARLVLTDSGGIQEETTALKIPCVTIRENTERPVTVSQGTNVIVGTNKNKIIKEALLKIKTKKISGKNPKFWDGKTAERIVRIILNNSG